jgi:hypothetical protein
MDTFQLLRERGQYMALHAKAAMLLGCLPRNFSAQPRILHFEMLLRDQVLIYLQSALGTTLEVASSCMHGRKKEFQLQQAEKRNHDCS